MARATLAWLVKDPEPGVLVVITTELAVRTSLKAKRVPLRTPD
jgi:hypothetical protein